MGAHAVKNATAALAAIVLSCSPPPFLTGIPAEFNYSSISSKNIAYAMPVVLSSEIFYENRFTDQSYHSIDRSRTQEAFSRDFRQVVGAANLGWRSCGGPIDTMVQRELSSVNSILDSLPSDLIRKLKNDGIDIIVLVYAMHLYHQQSIGLRPDKTGSVNSYNSILNRTLDYRCSIIDVKSGKPVFYVPVKRIQNDNSLNMMEQTVQDLLKAILRSGT
jgi:hypothetical protein